MEREIYEYYHERQKVADAHGVGFDYEAYDREHHPRRAEYFGDDAYDDDDECQQSQ